MKKQHIKFSAAILTLIMALTIVAPTAALARGYRHHGHRHHRHHSSRHWAWGLGALAVGGILLHKNTNQPEVHVYSSPSAGLAVYSYDVYKQNFLFDLDDKESALYIEIKDLEPNNDDECYKYPFDRDVTKRRLKKICTALYEDFKYIGVKDDMVYFQKLK